MNELLKLNYDNEKITLSARELHDFLEIGSHFKDWFPRMCEYGFKENEDFCSILSESTGGRPSIDYQITLDMAKELAMIQRTEKGKQARQYFIQIEKRWNSPEQVIARGLIESQKMISNLALQIEEMKPKAEFYDDVTGSTDTVEMATVSKVLNIKGMGRNNLFQFLREQRILQGDNQPYQTYVDRGYFRVVISKWNTPNGDIHTNYKTIVYPKGIDFIRRKLKENGYS